MWKVHVSASESVDAGPGSRLMLKCARSVRGGLLLSSQPGSFQTGCLFSSLNDGCLWSGKSSRWAKLSEAFNCASRNGMLRCYVCLHSSQEIICKINTDSIFFHSCVNPFLHLYPLYFLFCLVCERAIHTESQGVRVCSNLQVHSSHKYVSFPLLS